MRAVVGHSDFPDSREAALEALAQCSAALGPRPAQAGILLSAFGDEDYRPALQAVAAAHPGVQLIGCSTYGEMSSVLGFANHSTVLMLFTSERLEFAAGIGTGLRNDTRAAVQQAVSRARAGLAHAPSFCLTLPEGLSVGSVPLTDLLREALPPGVPVFGGAAAERFEFRRTVQFCGTEACEDSVPVLLISGDVRYSFGVASGWHPVGTPEPVTEAEGNLIRRIGDRTAVDFYRHYVGDSLSHIWPFPLAIRDPDSGAAYFLAPFGHDEAAGTVSMNGLVPPGARVQVAQAGRDEVLAAASLSALEARDTPGVAPFAAVLAFSCASRMQILGTRVGEEFEALAKAFGPVPIIGFYTLGEIGPLRRGGPSLLHNDTLVTLALGAAG